MGQPFCERVFMKKIVSAGHVCLDITPVFPPEKDYGKLSDLLVPGQLINVNAADIHPGGSVSNTGLALKLLGNDVCLLGKVGNDAFGEMIRSIFASYGASGLVADQSSSTSYSVVLAVPGNDRVFLHDPGANDSFRCADIPEDVLEEAKLFHFGYPSLMKQMYDREGEELEEMFRRAKEKGIATSLDFAAIDPDSGAGHVDWDVILKRVLPFVDFFVPSFEELCFMLDRERYERLSEKGGDMTDGLDLWSEAAALAERALNMGCRAVLIKCGTSGMFCKTGSRQQMEHVGERLRLDAALWSDYEGVQPCFRADIVRSGTGAGDTSIAAFLTAVIMGKTPEESVRLAAAQGACCVTAYDALGGLKSIEELEARIHAGWETV